ncbi:MAG: NAD(+) synthase [Clostridiales bacterium]|nr:NAD(+) synthase [Clostridiales bacterium]
MRFERGNPGESGGSGNGSCGNSSGGSSGNDRGSDRYSHGQGDGGSEGSGSRNSHLGRGGDSCGSDSRNSHLGSGGDSCGSSWDYVPLGDKLIFQCEEAPGFSVAAEICEDLWAPLPPSVSHALAGATIIANLSASDETIGKAQYRRSLIAGQSARLVCAYLYADAGNGESTTDMVFAGHNLICENGATLAESTPFGGGWAIADIDLHSLEHDRMRMNTYPGAYGRIDGYSRSYRSGRSCGCDPGSERGHSGGHGNGCGYGRSLAPGSGPSQNSGLGYGGGYAVIPFSLTGGLEGSDVRRISRSGMQTPGHAEQPVQSAAMGAAAAAEAESAAASAETDIVAAAAEPQAKSAQAAAEPQATSAQAAAEPQAASARATAMASAETDIVAAAAEPQAKSAQAAASARATAMAAAAEPPLLRHIDPHPFVPKDGAERGARCEEILNMQIAGLAKRIQHTGSGQVVVGVSGGLDSCLALLVIAGAFDKLGKPACGILAVTMPCFGTTARTNGNALKLCEAMGVTCREIDITDSVRLHLRDIGQPERERTVTYENAQARVRTLVLMDLANQSGGFVVGTGDLSELALGWATYNGDHMSMYGVNAGVPKTLVRHIVRHVADTCGNRAQRDVLADILETPVSPELLPPDGGAISQLTEELVGPYELHDFFLYHTLRWGRAPRHVFGLARVAFAGAYSDDVVLKWLRVFYRRFFSQQFKRSCMPDGPKIGSVTLSPRGDWRMPSDAAHGAWLRELDAL